MHDCFMQHILFVGHSPNLAGAEYSMLRLIQNLPKTLTISVLAPSGGIFEKEIKKLNLNFYHLDYNYAFYMKKDGHGNLNNFLSVLATQVKGLTDKLSKPDIIHSNTFFVWEGALLAAHWKIPHVWNLREIIMDSPTWNPQMNLNHQCEAMNLLTDEFVCVSQALTDKLPTEFSSKARAVHNGYEVKTKCSRAESRIFFNEKFNIPTNGIVCLTIGNFIPEKGYDWIFPICKNIIKENSNVFFLWIGAHHHSYNQIRSLIDDHQLQKNILTPGHIDFFNQYIKGADIYLLPSKTEAFPTTLLEAQFNNIPILSRECGGAHEIIEKGGGGYMCPHENPNEFETKLKEMIDNPIALETKKYYFTMERMVNGYMEVYLKAFNEYRENTKRTKFYNIFIENCSLFNFVPKKEIKPSFFKRVKIKLKLLLFK